MECLCALVTLKPGTLERAREWARELTARKDEVIITLRDEAVVVESVFLLTQADTHYLVYYMKGHDLTAAAEIARASIHPIDEYHRQFKKETWADVQLLEVLLDADTLATDARGIPSPGRLS
jgi:hypothetical protein